MYLLAIVSIVAIVGIVVLILNSERNMYYTVSEYGEESDLTGQVAGGSLRMMNKGGAGSECTSHDDCRSGHCNTNINRCA